MSGEELKISIEKQGVPKAELSRRLGISPQSFSQMLNAADVKSGFIEKICEALNISPAVLYGDEESKHLREEIAYLKQLLEEKERTIQILMKK